MPVLENIETIGYFTELFRADYEGMTEGDINTMMEAYLYGGEFVHESHHPFGNFISGILDVTIVKPLIECVIGKDLITGDKLTEFEQGMPPGVTFIASLLTGCTVSLEVGKYVFRDGGKIVKQLDADEMLECVGGGGKGGSDEIIKNSKVSIDDIKTNPSAFSGKSAEEIADVLRNSGYDVTIKNSTRSRSGAQIIQINNPGGGKNISQVQVSSGGGRHGSNPYIKISTTDQGIIKIVDGIESTYKTDGKETATIIFSGGN